MSRTKSQTHSDLVNDLMPQIQNISQIVQLCAFATEARRVLGDIDLAAQVSPELGESLFRLVEARSEWTCHEDNTGVVLRSVSHQLDAIHERLEAAS
ncbi:hypothetical protein [Rhodoferax sp.]|uniref:hypothetical protein n=1 Tax=Rhodoferax sp. TaxID=50421 RepID=UPI00272F7A75|nr:hypothetical protein [Rhodoferax sp.]MDP2443291.1 hypothetical protein [Rhodoferax sp.]MDZ4206815.1 hypothetical protein [Rhodoferax sp.]